MNDKSKTEVQVIESGLPVLPLPEGWREKLLEDAQKQAQQEATGSNWISTRGGVLTWQGQVIPGNKMLVVVLDSVSERSYYDTQFDPDVILPPVCFALGREDSKLVHHPNSSKPQAQGLCTSCRQAEFGSDPQRQKAPACKTRRRLSLMLSSTFKDGSALTAEIMGLKIPPTSVASWGNFVGQLATVAKRPPYGVITQVSLAPHPKTQFAMSFTYAGELSEQELAIAMMRRQQLGDSLLKPWDAQDPEADAAKHQAQEAEKLAASKRRRKF
jgi:hypothetical protein